MVSDGRNELCYQCDGEAGSVVDVPEVKERVPKREVDPVVDEPVESRVLKHEEIEYLQIDKNLRQETVDNLMVTIRDCSAGMKGKDLDHIKRTCSIINRLIGTINNMADL